MTIGRIMIDWWLLPLLALIGVILYLSLRFGKDTTLELLVSIDNKIDTIIDKL